MRSSRMLALIVVVMLIPATGWAQQTIYGCVKNNNGQMRIVAAGVACLPSEHAVQWALGAPTPSVVPPPDVPGALRVVDQVGAALGVLASPGYVARQIGDVWVGLPVNTKGFQLTDASGVMPYYQTTDCSGDAYLPLDMSNLLRTGVVMNDANGKPVFSYAGKPEVDYTTIKGVAYFIGGTWTCYPTTVYAYTPLFGKVTTLDVSTFQAPFTIVQ